MGYGILEYRASQDTGAVLADKKPVSFHCYLMAVISVFCFRFPFETEEYVYI
jgi:hypothetical protein